MVVAVFERTTLLRNRNILRAGRHEMIETIHLLWWHANARVGRARGDYPLYKVRSGSNLGRGEGPKPNIPGKRKRREMAFVQRALYNFPWFWYKTQGSNTCAVVADARNKKTLRPRAMQSCRKTYQSIIAWSELSERHPLYSIFNTLRPQETHRSKQCFLDEPYQMAVLPSSILVEGCQAKAGFSEERCMQSTPAGWEAE